MDSATIRAKIGEILLREVQISIDTIDNTKAIKDQNILDSLEFVSILHCVEDEFSIELSLSSVNNLTIDALVGTIEQQVAAKKTA